MDIRNIFSKLCTILALLFLVIEFYNFFFMKPTSSTNEKIRLHQKYFPTISICPEPAFSQEALDKNGYKAVWRYYVGRLPSPTYSRSNATEVFLGWGGTNKINQTQLLHIVSRYNIVKDLINNTYFSYKDLNGITQRQTVNPVEEVDVVYPVGKCVYLTPHPSILDQNIFRVNIWLKKELPSNLSNIGIFLNDPNNNVGFLPSPYKISEFKFVPNTEVTYFISTTVTEHLESASDCKVYKAQSEYRDCRVMEIREHLTDLIGCVPLWFTGAPKTCGPLNITQSTARSAYDFLVDVYTQNFHSRCKAPCTSVKYEASHKSTDSRLDRNAIFLFFDQDVLQIKSQLVVDGLSLINRVGGIIGFCRNLFWVLLIIIGVSKTFYALKTDIVDCFRCQKMRIKSSQ